MAAQVHIKYFNKLHHVVSYSVVKLFNTYMV